MNTARLSLLALSLLACAPMPFAGAQAAEPVRVKALGSFADFMSPEDYPAVALRFGMTGITGYSLTVDQTGNPRRCDIAKSSGFDVLDAATCQRLMAKARFSPGRDAAGKAVGGTYAGRVTWILPGNGTFRESEMFASLVFSIDRTGAITSCRMVVHVPTNTSAPPNVVCGKEMGTPPPPLGLELRGNYQGAIAEVEFQQGIAFTPALRERLLAPAPGYEQRALNVYHFTVGRDGTVGQCRYEEQRGSGQWALDFCTQARGKKYDPPFSAFDKDGVAQGWHVMRIVLKNAGEAALRDVTSPSSMAPQADP
jgi:TonB family protein